MISDIFDKILTLHLGPVDTDVFQEYLETVSPVTQGTDGRIIIKGAGLGIFKKVLNIVLQFMKCIFGK